MPPALRHRFQNLLAVTIGASIFSALFFRLAVIESVFGTAASCEDCFHGMVLAADAWYLSGLLLLTWLSFAVRPYALALLLRAMVLAGVVIYALDVAITLSFATRLNLVDLQIYGRQLDLLWRHISDAYELQWWQVAGIALGTVWVVTAFAWKHPRIELRRHHLALLVPACLLILAGFSPPSMSYVRKPAFKNVLAAVMPAEEYRNYSEATAQRVLGEAVAIPPECSSNHPQADAFILLILESWSPYQSELLTGLNDWTPRLDQLALENTYYRDLVSAGYTTNLGLMSILAGQPLVMSILPRRVFPGAWGLSHTLPKSLARLGYHTAFLTSGDLSFTDKGRWLEDIGFEYLEGHDYPGYDGIKRLQFRAVPDDVLYRRSLEYLDEAPDGEPLFLTIENVSSHQPFVHPYTRERNLEAVFRYMDETVFGFYQGLVQRGFFENGILLIVSDHRSMTPISAREQDLLGRRAASLVPMILIDGKSSGRVIDRPLHQADILPSLLYRAGGLRCEGDAIIWPGSDVAEKCRFHVRGDQRNLIDVFCHDGEGTVAVAGDNSRFVDSETLSEGRQSAILDEIARARLINQQQDDAYRD